MSETYPMHPGGRCPEERECRWCQITRLTQENWQLKAELGGLRDAVRLVLVEHTEFGGTALHGAIDTLEFVYNAGRPDNE